MAIFTPLCHHERKRANQFLILQLELMNWMILNQTQNRLTHGRDFSEEFANFLRPQLMSIKTLDAT